MKIIIMGGAGFVGRNLIRILKSKNYEVKNITVLDKEEKNLRYVRRYGVKAIYADLAENGEWLNELVEKDIVINLSAQISSPDKELFYRNNVSTTRNICEAAKIKNVSKIIHFSSAAVLSVRKDYYAQTKLDGEDIVKKSGLEYCILQPSIMYGPTDDKNIGYLINFAKKLPCFPIPGHGKWPRQPVYIDDICSLVILMFENFPHNKVYSINGKEIIYFRDMIQIVLKQIGGLKFRLFLPVSIFKFLMISYQKLTGNIQFTSDQVNSLTSGEVFPDYAWWEEFNINITSFEEGVKKMIKYETQEADDKSR